MMKFLHCAAAVSLVALPCAQPAAAAVLCNVAGDWQLQQTNAPPVTLRVAQFGNQLFGDARYRGGVGVIRDGRIHGRSVRFTIDWKGPVGEYFGGIRGGRMAGQTFDINNPRSQSTWFVTRKFAC